MSLHDPTITPRPRAHRAEVAFDGPVAIALSGGGFRAAGYHLGVLTVLHRTGLLGRAEVLTSTSAGTIVGMRLLLGLARGENYADIDHALRRYLLAAEPLRAAFVTATRTGASVVEAFADGLDRDLFANGNRPVARLQEILEARTSFREGSFSAALQGDARPFRFQFSRTEHACVGNGEVHLPRRIAEDIRCADVVAASCAFPGAFEPMVFPDDFTWTDEGARAAASQALGGRRFALVDGGLHDNQALDAMLIASERLTNAPGLFVVSDAERTQDGSETAPAARPRPVAPRFLTVGRLDAVALLVALGSLVTIGLVAEKARQEAAIGDFRLPADGIAYGAPIAFCLAVAALTLFVRRMVRRSIGPLLPEFGLPDLGRSGRRALRRTPVARVVGALHGRVQTLVHVTTTTFPRRLSGLVWRGAFGEERFAERRVAARIVPLDAASLELVENLYPPSVEVGEATRRAAAIGTSFALKGVADLDDLLLAGQAITVARLVELLELKHGPESELWPRAERELLARLVADWDRMNTSGRPLRPEDGTFRA